MDFEKRDGKGAIAGGFILAILNFVVGSLPTGLGFTYPEVIATLIPIDALLAWTTALGLLVAGIGVGWYAKTYLQKDLSNSLDRLEGCIKRDDVGWKGSAKISNGEIKEFSISDEPLCPECQTTMSRTTKRVHDLMKGGPETVSYWECPSKDCKHDAKMNYDEPGDSKKVLRNSFEQITKTEGEEYSLDKIIERIEGDLTPKKVWSEYVAVSDKSDVSTCCFH